MPEWSNGLAWKVSVRFIPYRGFESLPLRQIKSTGGVAEWLNAPVLKTGKGESPSWVQIPPPPPLIKKARFERAFFVLFPGSAPQPADSAHLTGAHVNLDGSAGLVEVVAYAGGAALLGLQPDAAVWAGVEDAAFTVTDGNQSGPQAGRGQRAAGMGEARNQGGDDGEGRQHPDPLRLELSFHGLEITAPWLTQG